MKPASDLITVADAARMLGISPRAVRFHLTSGALAFVRRVGRQYLIDAAAVEVFTRAAAGRPRSATNPASTRRTRR